jgi:hypothetical protein
MPVLIRMEEVGDQKVDRNLALVVQVEEEVGMMVSSQRTLAVS